MKGYRKLPVENKAQDRKELAIDLVKVMISKDSMLVTYNIKQMVEKAYFFVDEIERQAVSNDT